MVSEGLDSFIRLLDPANRLSTAFIVFDEIYHFTAIKQGRKYLPQACAISLIISSLLIAFFGILVGVAVSVAIYVLWLYFSYQQ